MFLRYESKRPSKGHFKVKLTKTAVAIKEAFLGTIIEHKSCWTYGDEPVNDLDYDFEVYFQGYFKVDLIFFELEPLFLTLKTEKMKNFMLSVLLCYRSK